MATKKEDLTEEEKGALDTPIDARIHTAELPPQTEQEVEDYCDKMWRQYPCFKTKEDAMYFSMLPLSRTDSALVLERAIEIEKQQRKGSETWKDAVSTR